MRAIVGDDDKLWKPLPGFFTPGTPLYTEEGGDILKGRRNVEAAKKLLAESGYKGEPVICVVAQDMSATKAMGDVTAELLKSIGMNVDFVATDWGTVGARRAPEVAAGAGRLEHVPHLACRRRLHQPGLLHRDPRQWRQGLVRLAQRAGGRDSRSPTGSTPRTLGRGEGRDGPLNKAAIENVVYAPTGLLSRLPRPGGRTSPA
jgi:peptide/nickel transport system substrate-binding protein